MENRGCNRRDGWCFGMTGGRCRSLHGSCGGLVVGGLRAHSQREDRDEKGAEQKDFSGLLHLKIVSDNTNRAVSKPAEIREPKICRIVKNFTRTF